MSKDQDLRLLSVKQVAELTGLAVSSVYRLIEQGQIQWVKLNGRKFVRPADAREFLVAQTVARTWSVSPPAGPGSGDDQPLLP